MRVRPKTYVRLRVGHLLKFGNSTRSYILTGPQADEEEVSEFSITELKEQKAIKEAELLQKQMEEEEEAKKKKEEEGASWGMSEDAEEESDLTENPFAMTNNEEFFVKDPKKTLRGFFEREGLNLEYKCDELSAGNFICKVELPIDDEMGNPIVCEVKHKGKKKECVEQCALECCRILDRHGMLRQANHEPRRSKKFEEDDSDDDGFYDRTGDVEKKQLKRSGQNQSEALTYEQLVEQENEISQKIVEKEIHLKNLIEVEKSQKQQNDDDLDSYMNNLNKLDNKVDKFAISSVKSEIQKLKIELQKIQKLAQIAKPSINLENIVKPQKSSLPLFGKRTALGRNFLPKKQTQIVKEVSKAETKFEVEEDEDDEKTNATEVSKKENKTHDEIENQTKPTPTLKRDDDEEPSEKKQKIEKANIEIIKNTSPSTSASLKAEEDPPKKKKTRFRIKKEYRQNVDMNDDEEFIDEGKSATWIPPEDQQGDGMTHLNAKFGY